MSQQLGDVSIELRLITQGVVQGIAAAENLRQQDIKLVEIKSLIRAKAAPCPGRASPATVPDFPLLVLGAHEQDELALRPARCQHRNGFGLVKAGQILKVTVLAKAIMCVAGAHGLVRCRNDGNAGLANAFHQLDAAFEVFCLVCWTQSHDGKARISA